MINLTEGTISALDSFIHDTMHWLNTDAKFSHRNSDVYLLRERGRRLVSMLRKDVADDLSRKISERSEMARESDNPGTVSSNPETETQQVAISENS